MLQIEHFKNFKLKNCPNSEACKVEQYFTILEINIGNQTNIILVIRIKYIYFFSKYLVSQKLKYKDTFFIFRLATKVP